jgi:hypothetical protein
VEYVPACGDLTYRDTFLEVFEADHTFVLFEFIHSFIESFFLDERNQGVHPLFIEYAVLYSWLPLAQLFLLQFDVPPETASTDAYSDYSGHTYEDEDSHQDKEY